MPRELIVPAAILLIFLIAVSVLRAALRGILRRAGNVGRIGCTLDGKAYIDSVRRLAVEIKGDGGGVSKGFKPHGERLIKRLYALAERKLASQDRLYEFEKWIYDNYYAVVSAGPFNLSRLPAFHGKPAIVELAGHIIDTSPDDLSKDRIHKGIYAYISVNRLTVDEAMLLKAAFRYAVLERLAAIAKRGLLIDKAKRAAGKKSLSLRYAGANAYQYFALNGHAADEILSYLERKKIDVENVSYVYSACIAEADAHASALVSYLLSKDIFEPETVLGFSGLHNKFVSDETYKNSDTSTKISYLKQAARLAKRAKTNQFIFCDRLMAISKESGKYYGELLFYYPSGLLKAERRGTLLKLKEKRTAWYSVLVWGLCLILTLAAVLAVGKLSAVLLAPLFFILFAETSYNISNTAAGLAARETTVFRMEYSKITADNRVMTAVSVLVSSKEQLSFACKHLEILKASNDAENAEFALLIDLPAAEEEVSAGDSEIISAIEEYRGEISFFVRKRTKNFGRYSGYERKRGAVMELSKLFCTGDGSGFRLIKRSKGGEKIKYLTLLDDDGELLPGSVIGLVNGIAHPLNSRFDLLTLGAKYNLFSIESRYSRRFRADAGIESYPFFSGLFFRLFRRDVFTGKGIARVDSLYEKLYGKLPENRVLSHDIIEGAVLNTSSSGLVVFEDAPSGFFSEDDRKKRWQKGDLLLLRFLKNSTNNAEGKPVGLKIDSFYKSLILMNALKIWRPFAFLFLVASAYFFGAGNFWLWFAVIFSALVLPALLSSAVRLTSTGISLRAKLRGLASIWLTGLRFLILSPYTALDGLLTSALTAYHLLFKPEKILKWNTFYNAQRDRRKKSLLKPFWPSFFLMTVLSAVEYFLLKNIAVSVAALLCLVAYLCDSTGVFNWEIKGSVPSGRRDYLMDKAQKSFLFFEKLLSENSLIADNYQSLPFIGSADGTSPTNIGFSLLALISNYFLKEGRVAEGDTPKALKEKILYGPLRGRAALLGLLQGLEGIISAAEKLRKKDGHLFNWYDIKSLKVLNPAFISSVDSANFIAALITAGEFLKLFSDKLEDPDKDRAERLRERVSKLIKACDFSALYDFKRELFYVGSDENGAKTGSRYDLLASESRLLSYLGTVNGLPCWFKLNRKLAKASGGTPYSWSGTMFEYLMADIFLKAPKASLLYRASKNASRTQSKTRCEGVFGLSESGYYRFDENSKYQYQAFGVNALALKSKSNECVISPYSSFLALKHLNGLAVKNLKRLEKKGLLGEFGFYEAGDFSEGKIVESFMAHHQGMILCAVTNYLLDDILSELFMLNDKTASGRHLLAERFPDAKPSRFKKNDGFAPTPAEDCYSVTLGAPASEPVYHIISNGRYSVLCDDSGRGYSSAGSARITKAPDSLDDPEGKYLYIEDTDGVYTPTYAPIFGEPENHSAEFKTDRCIYGERQRGTIHTVITPEGFNGEIHTFSFEPKKSGKVNLYFYGGSAVVGDNNAYLSHKTFYNMFIEAGLAFIDKAGNVSVRNPENGGSAADSAVNLKNCFILKRRGLKKHEQPKYGVMLVKGLDEVSPECNRYNFIGRLGSLGAPAALGKAPKYESLGYVLEPCFGFRSRLTLRKGEKKEFSVIIAYADSQSLLNTVIKRANTAIFEKLSREAPISAGRNILALTRREKALETGILNAMIHSADNEKLKEARAHALFERRPSEGEGLIYKSMYYRYSGGSENQLLSVLKIYRNLTRAGLSVRLILSDSRSDLYHDPVKRYASEILSDLSGVRIIDHGSEADKYFSAYSRLNVNSFIAEARSPAGGEELTFARRKDLDELIPLSGYGKLPEAVFDGGAGYFTLNGDFVVLRTPKRPYSNVAALENGGTVMTENGGGFTFFDNSRENKVSAFSNDPVADTPAERLFLFEGRRFARVNRGGTYTLHKKGVTVFFNAFPDYTAEISEYMILGGHAKIFEAEIINISSEAKSFELLLDIRAALGDREDANAVCYEYGKDFVKAFNLKTLNEAVLKAPGGLAVNCLSYISREGLRRVVGGSAGGAAFAAAHRFPLKPGESKKAFFVLAKNLVFAEGLAAEDKLLSSRLRAAEYFEGLNNITIETGDKYLDTLFNSRLMLQLVSSRMNGRLPRSAARRSGACLFKA